MPQPVRRLPHVWPSISPDALSAAPVPTPLATLHLPRYSLCPTLLSSLPQTNPKAVHQGTGLAARRTGLGFHGRCCADSTLGLRLPR